MYHGFENEMEKFRMQKGRRGRISGGKRTRWDISLIQILCILPAIPYRFPSDPCFKSFAREKALYLFLFPDSWMWNPLPKWCRNLHVPALRSWKFSAGSFSIRRRKPFLEWYRCDSPSCWRHEWNEVERKKPIRRSRSYVRMRKDF